VRADAGAPQEIETAFFTMVREKAGALIVLLNPLFYQQRSQIAELAAKHRLPAIAGDRVFAEAGCLMSYGASLADDFHRLATYVDKILKGAKPADLPVEQPTKFELVINLKTAKTLGLTIPQSVLARADEVIE
jgi:putative ABC transport system substrate-binding protein